VNWLLHVLGVDDVSGRWYGWWSGAGSDLGELAIVGGLVAVYRKHTCEVHRCWRLGRHTTAAGHVVCRKHHPDDPLTPEAVIKAHQAAQNPYPPQAERRA
jgi:hypothetical protein